MPHVTFSDIQAAIIIVSPGGIFQVTTPCDAGVALRSGEHYGLVTNAEIESPGTTSSTSQ